MTEEGLSQNKCFHFLRVLVQNNYLFIVVFQFVERLWGRDWVMRLELNNYYY